MAAPLPPPPHLPPPPSDPGRESGRAVAAAVVVALLCWGASIIPLGIAVLSLLCDVDGECTPDDTNRRVISLVAAMALWVASGPLAMAIGRRKWLLGLPIVPFLLAAPLLPYFIAGP